MVTASRAFVCIRPATYESAEEAEILLSFFRKDELENTIFIYTSDHGEALGDHGLWLKNNLLEPAAHVPLAIAGPGIPRGRRVDHVVSHVDLVQSLLEWGGAGGGSELRGHSLIPLMSGAKAALREAIRYAYDE